MEQCGGQPVCNGYRVHPCRHVEPMSNLKFSFLAYSLEDIDVTSNYTGALDWRKYDNKWTQGQTALDNV